MSDQHPRGRDDEATTAIVGVASGLSRRGLLTGAAGGFTLVAGGLVTPPLLQAVLAGSKHKGSRPQSGVNQRDIGFEIQNHRSATVQFQSWAWNAGKKRWDGGDAVTLNPPGPGDGYFVLATDGRLAFRFGDGHFVLGHDANDQTVLLEIGEGPCDADGCARDHILVSQRLHEEETVSAANILITRLRNTKRVLCHVDVGARVEKGGL